MPLLLSLLLVGELSFPCTDNDYYGCISRENQRHDSAGMDPLVIFRAAFAEFLSAYSANVEMQSAQSSFTSRIHAVGYFGAFAGFIIAPRRPIGPRYDRTGFQNCRLSAHSATFPVSVALPDGNSFQMLPAITA